MSNFRKYALLMLLVMGVGGFLYVITQSLSTPKAARNPLATYLVGEMKEVVLLGAPPAQPDVTFEGPDGQASLKDFRGKTVLLNLWASWCAPCVEELPSLDRLQGEIGNDDFMVLALNMDRSKADAEAFLNETNIKNIALYHDNRFAVAKNLTVPGLPSGLPITVLYDKNGVERARLSGGANWNGGDARALIAAVQSPSLP